MSVARLRSAVCLALSTTLMLTYACSRAGETVQPVNVASHPAEQAHSRKLDTPSYVGDRGAIIFTIPTTDNSSTEVVDRMVRLFAQNGAPLDVSISPVSSDNYGNLAYLASYIDAGVIDVSTNGKSVEWLESVAGSQPEQAKLASYLQRSRESMTSFFGVEPVACVFPSDDLSQTNYSVVQAAGFKVLSTAFTYDVSASGERVNWSGNVEAGGLFRLPVVGSPDYSAVVNTRVPASLRENPDRKFLDATEQSINDLGIAVIELEPESYLGADKKPDSAKLTRLSDLLKSLQTLAEVTTFNQWYEYSARWSSGVATTDRVLPAFGGGKAIIFRMDDVSVGWHEDVVEAIIRLFQKNGVPVDLGIVSNVDGTNSFAMPWLKPYVSQGVVGISVHGYDWTYYQFDTSQDFKSQKAISTDYCYLPGAAEEPEIPKEHLTYAYIKLKLMKARDQYLQYFGVKPIALTVPTDFYDETGYRAIQDAGFKVFATQITAEPHPSTIPIGFSGSKDANGMYRIPTASDVCVWDNCTWGDVFDISQIASIPGYCTYHAAWDEVSYSDLGAMLCGLLGSLGVVAIGIHPDAFVGIDGKPNQAKLDKLDLIIKWTKSVAAITTFEQWYNYASSQK